LYNPNFGILSFDISEFGKKRSADLKVSTKYRKQASQQSWASALCRIPKVANCKMDFVKFFFRDNLFPFGVFA
jgi:hypothetical protein